jgi:hypothetical protein
VNDILRALGGLVCLVRGHKFKDYGDRLPPVAEGVLAGTSLEPTKVHRGWQCTRCGWLKIEWESDRRVKS